MKNAEEAMAKVLAGLGQAQASPQFESRLAHGLQRRSAIGAAAHRTSRTFVVPGRRLVLGFGCLVVLSLFATRMRRAERLGASQDRIAAKAGEIQRATELTDKNRATAQSISHRIMPASARHRKDTSQVVSSIEPLSVRPSSARRGNRVAVGFPAPPMPLTQQERLLLRVAAHPGPEEMAMLDASERATQDVEETALFQSFFGKAQPLQPTNQRVDQGESR